MSGIVDRAYEFVSPSERSSLTGYKRIYNSQHEPGRAHARSMRHLLTAIRLLLPPLLLRVRIAMGVIARPAAHRVKRPETPGRDGDLNLVTSIAVGRHLGAGVSIRS